MYIKRLEGSEILYFYHSYVVPERWLTPQRFVRDSSEGGPTWICLVANDLTEPPVVSSISFSGGRMLPSMNRSTSVVGAHKLFLLLNNGLLICSVEGVDPRHAI